MISCETIDRYAEVPIEVATEIGRTTLTVRELLEFDDGTLVPLSRSASTSVDLLIGGAPVGRGEIIVNDGSIALRIGQLREEA